MQSCQRTGATTSTWLRVNEPKLSVAQDAPAAPATATVEPRRLTRDEKKLAKSAIKAAFAAGDDAERQAALATVVALPPLTRSDLRWAQKQVLIWMRVGTRVAKKTKGVIKVKGYPGVEGHYFLSGSKGKKRTPFLVALHGGGAGVGAGSGAGGSAPSSSVSRAGSSFNNSLSNLSR